MTWLDEAGLDEDRRQTVRALLDELVRQPPAFQRVRLRELTGDAQTIAIVEQLLEQRTRTLDAGLVPLTTAMSKLPDTELQTGDVLGAWRLAERVASGGMGTVFVAERADDLYHQRVAIKLLHGRADAVTVERMAIERQLLAKLQHPGIARLYDGGTTPAGNPYLVMEYVDGLPLHRYCAGHRPGLAERIELFQNICRTVECAHRHMIVHCDLKPGNVLVRPGGEPVLLDFGIARALGSDDGQAGFCTPAYASPELLDGNPVSTASDVFSLGVLLIELLSAQRVPVEGDNRLRPLPAPSQLAGADAAAWRAKLPGDLDAIAARACALDPRERYATAAELHDDLQRYREHRPVLARRATPGYRLGRLLRRRWRDAAALAAVGLLSSVFVWQLAEQRDAAQRAALTAEQVSGLLADSFKAADPKLGGGSTDVTARDVLDAGAARLQQVNDPAVLARLRDVLGNAYLHLGQPAIAEPLMTAAVEGYLDPAVRQPRKAAEVLAELAVLHSNGGHRQEAIAVARRALALHERFGDPQGIANALNSLGVALSEVDNDEAERVLTRSLELRMRDAGELSTDVASTLHNLGNVAWHRGDHVAAEAYFRRSLQIKREMGMVRSTRYETTLTGLSRAVRGQGRLEEAAELQREILALSYQLHGDGTNVGGAHNELAYTLHDLGRWSEAAQHYLAAERLTAAASGTDSVDFAVKLNNHAWLDEDRGAIAEAERRYRRSLQIRRAHLQHDSVRVLNASFNLGRLLLRSGRLAEAGTLIEDAWVLWRQSHPEHGATTGNRLLFTEWLIADGRTAQAHEELQALASQVERARHVAWRQSLLADLSRIAGDRTAAIGQRRRAVEIWAGDVGADHVETARRRVDLARALLAGGDIANARAELARAQRVLAPQLVADAPLRTQMRALQARL